MKGIIKLLSHCRAFTYELQLHSPWPARRRSVKQKHRRNLSQEAIFHPRTEPIRSHIFASARSHCILNVQVSENDEKLFYQPSMLALGAQSQFSRPWWSHIVGGFIVRFGSFFCDESCRLLKGKKDERLCFSAIRVIQKRLFARTSFTKRNRCFQTFHHFP